ncbi:alpha/beta hydrolase [Segetibacter aerophilus]|uniref:Esterase n=1 Tax=Segetibacter aerophilus TaxID=670293 RepID=A0A512BIP2_9BACT|nr:alpha/beta hydrolase family protein [Segetibacter aerophilus]GEO11830.1 esterase [Segetibacter aerophilus]
MKYLNKKLSWSLLLVIAIFQTADAAIVDTVQTYSPSMKKNIKAVVITPDNYANATALPVVYLLHGYSGNYADWITKAKGFEKNADLYQMIIVCPDGNNSWYWDSPVDEKYKYETYVSDELVKWIDGKYKTIKDRKGRAITGLSMGGHGGLLLAFRHQDVFGAAGSMSGGVDIRPFPNNWDMAARLGKYAEHPENWEKNTVANMLYLLTPNSLSLIIDCGTEDFFFKVNENLHEQLQLRNIPHDFIARPGGHNWPYWTNAINYQLLFMNTYFKTPLKK